METKKEENQGQGLARGQGEYAPREIFFFLTQQRCSARREDSSQNAGAYKASGQLRERNEK